MIENSVISYEELGQGNYRKEINIKPVHYFRDGLWRPIENQLGNSGDPNFTIGSDELFNFRIKDRLSGNSPLIHINKNDDSVNYTPLNTNNTEGIVNGNSIKFIEAWNNADLEIILNGHMIKKNIYLRAGHPQSFSFRIDEKINLDNDLVGAEFYMNNPYLYKEKKETINLTWDKTTQGGKTIMTVILPEGSWEGWTLDPTYTSQPDGTAGLDVNIRLNNGANQNSVPTILVCNYDYEFLTTYSSLPSSAIEKASSFIKFDLSSVPAGSSVTSASLYLRSNYNEVPQTITIYRTLRAWVETQTTWYAYATGLWWGTAGCLNSTSDYNNSSVASFTPTINDNNVSLSTSLIQAMIPSGSFTNNGFVLHNLDTNTGADNSSQFFSSEYSTASYRPKLTIVYTESGGATKVPMFFMNYTNRRRL